MPTQEDTPEYARREIKRSNKNLARYVATAPTEKANVRPKTNWKKEVDDALSLFKSRIPAGDVADVFIEGVRRDVKEGQKRKPLLAQTENEQQTKEEWLYFDAFNIDYCVFLALGQTPEKKAILDRFWAKMKQWLTTVPVSPLPERGWSYDGEFKTIPAEGSETAFDRMKRRCAIYGAAIAKPHTLGESHGIALTFGILCGQCGASFTAGISRYFTTRTIEWVKMLQPHRISVP